MEDFDIRKQRYDKEQEFEKALRPLAFGDFSGQEKIIENLRVFVEAAKMRGESLDHVLLHGPPGLGKRPSRISLPTNWGWGLKSLPGRFSTSPEIWRVFSHRLNRTTCFLSMKYIVSVRLWRSISIRRWKISVSTS